MKIAALVESRTYALAEGDLARLTNDELDGLSRANPPGHLPAGVVRGRAYVLNGTTRIRGRSLVRDGAYFFLPGIRALRFLAGAGGTT